jgi:ParB family chromosome partitioning protein
VEERGGERVVDGGVEVHVGEHHVRVLAAQLQGELLHAGRGERHDPLTGGQPAGERDQVDAGVGDHGGADRGARAEQQVDHAVRYAGFRCQTYEVHSGQWGDLARLAHHRVPGGQRGGELPGQLQQRVVPRGDERAHAHRLVHHPAEHVRVAGVDHPAGVRVGEARVVAEHGGDVVDVDPSFAHGLAGVGALRPRECLAVSREEVRDRAQHVTTFPGRRRTPWPVECPAGGGDGRVHLGLRGFADGR